MFVTKKNHELISLAIKCIIIEAASYPSFGLVSKVDNGCHQDMNYNLLEKSALTFNQYFTEIEQLVLTNDKLLFSQLRILGKKQEQRMLQATNGINTHKGLIFAFGIVFYVLFYCIKNNINNNKMSKLIKKMTVVLNSDFKKTEFKTKGMIIYQKYKILGARGLALSGYKIVFNHGIKLMHFYQKKYQLNDEQIALVLLVFYLSQVNDTTLISKTNYETSKKIQKQAKIWLRILKEKGFLLFYQEVMKHNQNYQKRLISPGGCADLVVITLFLGKLITY